MKEPQSESVSLWLSRDFVAGFALVLVGIAAIGFTAPLPMGQLNNFGPRMFPLIGAIGVGGLGAVLMAMAFRDVRERIEALSLRGPLFVVAGLLLFAFTIRPLGLLPASFLVYFVGGLGSTEARIGELAFWGVVAAVACSLLFVTLLGLPLSIVRSPWG